MPNVPDHESVFAVDLQRLPISRTRLISSLAGCSLWRKSVVTSGARPLKPRRSIASGAVGKRLGHDCFFIRSRRRP
jgi:hypothetical protein